MKRFGTVTAMNLFLVAMIIILIFLDEEGAFEKFTHIGPSNDVKFLNIKVNTWSKTTLVYIISFLSAFLTQFFRANITTGFFYSQLANHAINKLDVTRTEAQYLIWVHPLSWWFLGIVGFMVTLSMQLQFMLFALLGSMCAEIPFYLSFLSDKKTL
jgi:hypothetical protein